MALAIYYIFFHLLFIHFELHYCSFFFGFFPFFFYSPFPCLFVLFIINQKKKSEKNISDSQILKRHTDTEYGQRTVEVKITHPSEDVYAYIRINGRRKEENENSANKKRTENGKKIFLYLERSKEFSHRETLCSAYTHLFFFSVFPMSDDTVICTLTEIKIFKSIRMREQTPSKDFTHTKNRITF